VIKKSDIKIKQLNIQLNKLRNALNAEKAMLRKEVEKSKNLETELDGMKKKCARIDENHNVLIDLNCNYNELNNEKYSCNARDLKVKIENSTIENPNGNHKRGKRDSDVNSLIISNQDVKYIPNGISNHFPQLKELTIENSGLVKINQAPLRNLPHLNKLIIRGNDIYHIEPTALNDIPQLEHLDLSQNNIMDIPIKFLEEMPKLKILNLNDNALLSLPQNIIPNVNSLKTFTVGNNNLNFIDPRIFKRLDSASVVDFTNNKCIDKKFNENDDDRRDYMSFIGIVSIKCTNNIDDSGEDGFCTGRKI
jgi:Leucine-rich repeat (LRR) protein